MTSFHLRFKQLREQHQWTQDEIAEKLGVQRSTIAGYESAEKNRIPREETLLKIADVFQVSLDYLLGRSDLISQSPTGHPPVIPDWATAKDKRDLKVMLESPEVLFFDGIEFSEEDRAKMMGVMETIFWDAKMKNKEAWKKSRAKKKS
ncbi:helix-turn-helix domain-containing protein [Paenibacillus pinihumi]|uniref:helix-turn-helix domain-containing protein n=1 Tax=Paenibacillus pinihumi TaxID=669462 RepID=UPI00040AEC7F|nr:helix-turn-helix transcriptional regulator [Paenibacillus pinihumi]